MDTKTVRLRATLTIEYDAYPADYGTSNPEQMAKIDMDMSDPVLFDWEGGDFKVEPV